MDQSPLVGVEAMPKWWESGGTGKDVTELFEERQLGMALDSDFDFRHRASSHSLRWNEVDSPSVMCRRMLLI